MHVNYQHYAPAASSQGKNGGTNGLLDCVDLRDRTEIFEPPPIVRLVA